MGKQQKTFLVLAIISVFVGTGIFLPGPVGAGDLEPPGAPAPTMKTLDEIPASWHQTLPASDRFEGVMYAVGPSPPLLTPFYGLPSQLIATFILFMACMSLYPFPFYLVGLT